MIEVFNEIWATARRNKLRTALTGFAVAWGIFMLIVLLGAGNGVINAQIANSGNMMDNSMMVGAGRTSMPYKGYKEGRHFNLSARKDLRTLTQTFGGNVDEAGAQVYKSGTLTRGENYIGVSLQGNHPITGKINKVRIVAGRYINDIDIKEHRRVMVVSDQVAKELLHGDIATLVGQQVKASGSSWQVVGIYADNNTGRGTTVHVPFTTLATIYGKGDNLDQLVFTFHGLNTEEENAEFEQQLKAQLNRNHDAAPNDASATWIWNRFTQAMQMDQGVGYIRLALWVIGLLTLLSGVVGVSNIMLITVKERTREFGIRKAIGASPASILRLILVESTLITLAFGYIGMVLGMAANAYMDATLGGQVVDSGLFQIKFFENPTVGLDICVEATLVVALAGTIAGLLPARKAARIRPIEALRAE